MDFEKLLKETIQSFPNYGSFTLYPGQDIRKRIKESSVPDKPGIYFIWGIKGEISDLMYIGKAGTVKNKGSFKDQKLFSRLSAKQEGTSRQNFFQQKMVELHLDYLLFHWFVTFNGDIHIIPAKAEADSLQKYFDENSHLPPWNINV